MGLWIHVIIYIAKHGYDVVEVFNRYYCQVDTTLAKPIQDIQMQRNVRFYFCLDCIINNDIVHVYGPH